MVINAFLQDSLPIKQAAIHTTKTQQTNLKFNIATDAEGTNWTLYLQHCIACSIFYVKLWCENTPLLLYRTNHRSGRRGYFHILYNIKYNCYKTEQYTGCGC